MRRASAMVCLLLILACTTATGMARNDTPANTLPKEEMARVISYGLDVIAARSLEPSDIRSLALDGLHGIIAIDPDLTLRIVDNWIHLEQRKSPIGAFATPAKKDPLAWGQLIVSVIKSAEAISPQIRTSQVDTLYQALFNAALVNLDPFSRYAGPKEAAENRASRNGYGGVGMSYRVMMDHLLVLDVIPDTPAELSGLMKGDKITGIEGVHISDLRENDAEIRQKIRGSIGSPVRLTVERDDLRRDILVKRGLTITPTVTIGAPSEDIPVIRISHFNQNTAESLANAVQSLQKSYGDRLKALILDVRGNPGGLLDQAVDCAALFIPSGRILSTLGRHPEAVQSYSAHHTDILDGRPMAILLDERSASAAEILGSALQDRGRALVVGTTSYGKGTVQTIIRLPNDGELTLTWSRLHAPAGYALNRLGVMPTICTSRSRFGHVQPLQTIGGDIRATEALALRWRKAGLTDRTGRDALRSICPPESHENGQTDISVARSLLKSQSLYHRAIAAVMAPPPPGNHLR